MARIVLSTIGTRGDLNPFLSLGLGLRVRGHDVLFAVEEVFRSPLEEANFAVHCLGGDVATALTPAIHQLTGGVTPIKSLKVLVDEWILPTLRAKIDDLRVACTGADLLIARGIVHPAAPIAADLAGIPWVHVTMTPLNIPSAYVNPYVLPMLLPVELPPLVNRIVWATMSAVLRNMTDGPINSVRAEYGLPPGRDLMGVGNHSRTLTAVIVSPTFLPPQPDWPSYVRMVGYCFWDTPASWREPEALTAFLDSGEPVIAVSFGSMAPYVRDAFAQSYKTSIAAIRCIGARALVIGAAPDILPDPLPECVFALPFAPFSQIYPRCAAAIHHGGPYTVGEALRAGIPALVVPWGIDQFFTAAHVQRIGVGRWIHHQVYTPKKAARALDVLLHETRYKTRTQTLAAQIAHEDGVATFCNAIEVILQRPVPLP